MHPRASMPPIPAHRVGFARRAASARTLRICTGRRSQCYTVNSRPASACCPCPPPAGPALSRHRCTVRLHPPRTRRTPWPRVADRYNVTAAFAICKVAEPDHAGGFAQGLRTGGGSGAFSPVHPTPKESLGAAAAANAAFVSSPRAAAMRESPVSTGQLTGPGGKGSSSMFVGPSRPRSAAARALLAGTTLHPVVQLGWQPLCEVHCNGCAAWLMLLVAHFQAQASAVICWRLLRIPCTSSRQASGWSGSMPMAGKCARGPLCCTGSPRTAHIANVTRRCLYLYSS